MREEIERIRRNEEIDEPDKNKMLRVKKMKSIADVLEEVGVVLVDTHFFVVFSQTKSSTFLKKVIENQRTIDITLPKKTWRQLNCIPKTMKVIREIQESFLCVGKRRELVTKKMVETQCWCIKTGCPKCQAHRELLQESERRYQRPT